MSVLVCPVCQGQMREVNHEGVLIDTCTRCRGVWLDRGELEKLSSLVEAPQPAGYVPASGPRYRDNDYDDDERWQRRDGGGYRRQSKVSRFLDFFD